MGIRLVHQLYHLTDDEQELRRQHIFDRMSYTEFYERTHHLTAGYKTDIHSGMSTIQFIYIVSDEELRIYKNLSPEYWLSGKVFLIFDTEIAQLALMATAAASVYIYLGGEA